MASPYKGLRAPKVNVNDYTATQTVPNVPGKDIAQENEERSDVVRDGEQEIPWPPAPGTDHNPMKLKR